MYACTWAGEWAFGGLCAETRPHLDPRTVQVVFKGRENCVATAVVTYATRLLASGWSAGTLRQHLTTLALNEVRVPTPSCMCVCLRLAGMQAGAAPPLHCTVCAPQFDAQYFHSRNLERTIAARAALKRQFVELQADLAAVARHLGVPILDKCLEGYSAAALRGATSGAHASALAAPSVPASLAIELRVPRRCVPHANASGWVGVSPVRWRRPALAQVDHFSARPPPHFPFPARGRRTGGTVAAASATADVTVAQDSGGQAATDQVRVCVCLYVCRAPYAKYVVHVS